MGRGTDLFFRKLFKFVVFKEQALPRRLSIHDMLRKVLLHCGSQTRAPGLKSCLTKWWKTWEKAGGCEGRRLQQHVIAVPKRSEHLERLYVHAYSPRCMRHSIRKPV